MWDNRFVFVLSALVSVAIWGFIFKRNEARKAHRSPLLANILLALCFITVTLVLAIRLYYHRNAPSLLPGPATALSFVIGSAVGSFSARFVWSLYGARFGAKDPLVGVLTLLLLIIVYSLPVYQTQISSLFSHLGGASLKTPFVELTFTRPSQLGRVVGSAANPQGGARPSALPRPSYPRPGLIGLRQVVDEGRDDYLVKDARYIAFFDGRGDSQPGVMPTDAMDGVLLASRNFLRPAKTLARCLLAYVEFIPDSQLLLIDIKPVIQFFFEMNAKAALTLRNGSVRPENPDEDFRNLQARVSDVVRNVQKVLPSVDITKDCPAKTNEEIAAERMPDLQNFSYLQPYVVMALANLLVAHGSPDEAIDVLAQWLLLWSCARGEYNEKTGCDLYAPPSAKEYSQRPTAGELPEWFRIRAEFELKALLYQQAGESNIAYRDFLGDLTKHFADYIAKPQLYDRRRHLQSEAPDPPTGISIREELQRCEERKARKNGNRSSDKLLDTASPAVHTIMLRQLLQNENDLLRSDLHFLDNSWVEMENLHDRALALARLDVECVSPEQDESYWKATLADYKITSGLLALAIADKLATHADSADERNRAVEIKIDGKRELRDGYRVLDGIRREERKQIERQPWSKRLFEISQWEESCALAEHAINQLDMSESNP
jgi:hypothetical protein